MNHNPIKTESHRNLVSLNGVISGIALVFSSFAFASTASAADYYVATTGSDSNTATQAQSSATPWKTIQKAANTVPAGSTVHVAPGTYASLITISGSGTASAHTTFVSDTKWGAKITGTSSTALIYISGSYIDFKNFEITGSVGSTDSAIEILGSYTRIIGNKIHDVNATAIMTWSPNFDQVNNDMIGNLVYNITGGTLMHGIYVMQNGGLIQNNIVYNSSGYGIHAWHAANSYTISNNLLWNCQESGIVVGNGDDPGGTTADNFVVTNNISINNGNYGITEEGSTGTHNTYQNNLVYGNPQGGIALQNGNTAQNTRTVDPKLVNFKSDGTGDYHLSATSPAIAAGTTTGAPTTDFAGAARTGNPDIGAYAYGSGSLALNPPSNPQVVVQ